MAVGAGQLCEHPGRHYAGGGPGRAVQGKLGEGGLGTLLYAQQAGEGGRPRSTVDGILLPDPSFPPHPSAKQGLDASLVGVVPYAAIRLGSYDAMRHLWRRSTGAGWPRGWAAREQASCRGPATKCRQAASRRQSGLSASCTAAGPSACRRCWHSTNPRHPDLQGGRTSTRRQRFCLAHWRVSCLLELLGACRCLLL